MNIPTPPSGPGSPGGPPPEPGTGPESVIPPILVSGSEMGIAQYRERARECLSELNYESYRYHAGLKTSLELTPIYQRYSELFHDTTIRSLLDLHAEAEEVDERALRNLLNFAVDTAMDMSVREEDEMLALLKSTATLHLGERTIGFHSSSVMLANEDDRSVREAVFSEREKVLDEGNTARLQRLRTIHRRSHELTGRSYLDLYQFLFKLDFQLLERQILNFLEASDAYYEEAMERFAQQSLAIPASEVALWDIPYLFRGSRYDGYFPQDRSLSVLKKTLLGLDVDLKKQRNLIIDSDDRPSKSERPKCIPVSIPNLIYLVIRPQGGVRDYLTLFHEVGRALHRGFTSANEDFENKYLGDPAVTETYAFLFEHLTLNAEWLSDMLRMPRDCDFIDFNQLRKLYTLRRYSGRFLFELTLHKGETYDAGQLQSCYVHWMKRALGIPPSSNHYLHDIENAFHSAHYLRAWTLETDLGRLLTSRFGERWYTRPAAGDFLKGLWSHGQRYTAEELAHKVRSGDLDMAHITEEFC